VPGGVAVPISNLASNWSDPDGDPVILNDVNDTSTNGVTVTFDSHFIYYVQPVGTPVADAIFYTVQDLRTNPPAVYRPGDTQRTATGIIHLLPPPSIGAITLSGSTIVLSGSNGAPGGTYYVLSSTNLTLPQTNWTPLTTNMFDINGNFSFTNSPNLALPQTFYRLRVQ
jgi:hypothetical protein